MDSRSISRSYDAFYFAHSCGRPYQRDEVWLTFFASIAERIASDINPTTVLDAGCAMGFLVEALRDRDVEAVGVDISEYAIENVRADVRPYCWTGSVTDSFPKRYDLIVCLELLEHLSQKEAEEAIENICQHTDDVLFSSTPFDYKEATHLNVQPPDYWAERFARRGFFRDVDFDGSFVTPWAARFRKSRENFARVVAGYERRLWQLEKENQARRQLTIEQRDALAGRDREVQILSEKTREKEKSLEALTSQLSDGEQSVQALSAQLAAKDLTVQTLTSRDAERQREVDSLSAQLSERDQAIRTLSAQVSYKEAQLTKITSTLGWRILSLYGPIKYRFVKPLLHFFKPLGTPHPAADEAYLETAPTSNGLQQPGAEVIPVPDTSEFPVLQVTGRPPVERHQARVDIIICVHSALGVVKRCLQALIQYTRMPYSFILVDDGSDEETRGYLVDFAVAEGAMLLRNELAAGFALAADKGLRHSNADYVVILNSDVEVTPGWLERMVACAESDGRIGLVGPLSNYDPRQSIPQGVQGNEGAVNPLPEGARPADMEELLSETSSRLYPRLPFLNGFCLMLKRDVINEVGYFDEASFGVWFVGEMDYRLRAGKAGWQLALADDVYVSYSPS